MTKPEPSTVSQRGRIYEELHRLNAALPFDEDTPWVAELNSRCNLNLDSIDELTKQEASEVITQLLNA